MEGIPILTFLENVASTPSKVKARYSKLVDMKGAKPITIQAGRFGWHCRRRTYWIASDTEALDYKAFDIPSCFQWAGGAEPELQYISPTPMPATILFEGGYHSLLDPTDIVSQGGKGAAHTLTREFRHPGDRMAQASPAAQARCKEDDLRFPPSAYEDNCLVWDGKL